MTKLLAILTFCSALPVCGSAMAAERDWSATIANRLKADAVTTTHDHAQAGVASNRKSAPAPAPNTPEAQQALTAAITLPIGRHPRRDPTDFA